MDATDELRRLLAAEVAHLGELQATRRRKRLLPRPFLERRINRTADTVGLIAEALETVEFIASGFDTDTDH